MGKSQSCWNKRLRCSWEKVLLAGTVAMLGATVCTGSALAQAQFSGGQGGGGGGGGFSGRGGGGYPLQQAADPSVRCLRVGTEGALTAFSAVEGGSSPTTNREMPVATSDGATNAVPSLVMVNGPMHEARLVLNPNGMLDEGRHDLFVSTGRFDAPGHTAQQPNVAGELVQSDVIFRSPTPVLGDGPRYRVEFLFNEITT